MKHTAPQFDLPGTADAFNLTSETAAQVHAGPPQPEPARQPDFFPDVFKPRRPRPYDQPSPSDADSGL